MGQVIEKDSKVGAAKAKDFDGWWPLSKADVILWVSSLTELPITSDGESTKNALLLML
jgi:hypothetical protein